MVDACLAHGIFAYYGPFGDIKDTVACEDQFRNAFLLGCVGRGASTPRRSTSPSASSPPTRPTSRHAREVVAAMGDGTGAVMLNGKMEDDASVKQCKVMLDLADQLAAKDPDLAKAYAEGEG